jgi:hypothetical protein
VIAVGIGFTVSIVITTAWAIEQLFPSVNVAVYVPGVFTEYPPVIEVTVPVDGCVHTYFGGPTNALAEILSVNTGVAQVILVPVGVLIVIVGTIVFAVTATVWEDTQPVIEFVNATE